VIEGGLRRFLSGDIRWKAAPRDPLLGQIAEGGTVFERLVLTRNRRVMVSVGDRGRTLRLHEVFRDAPADVLRAVGVLYSRRSAASRLRARGHIESFLSNAVAPTGPVRRARRPSLADRPHLDRLLREFERVNAHYFGGRLPTVPLRLSGRMRRRNGHFSAEPLEIAIARRLCTEGEEGEAERTLRHEMIHLWQWIEGQRPGHGADFRRWAVRLEIHPRATRRVVWREGLASPEAPPGAHDG